jgi:hypothetical protein
MNKISDEEAKSFAVYRPVLQQFSGTGILNRSANQYWWL